MKLNIELNGRNFTVEADSVVDAVLKIIDAGFNETDNTEFQVARMVNSNYKVSINKNVA
ncbi:MAG TPA: hypothetical protein VHT96_10010 [Clostridia bacterium]|nr:hypothetical protein [Clostridia bacterium]